MIQAHVSSENRRPGNILALNKRTGVEHYIRPEMLDIDDHPWEVIDHEALRRERKRLMGEQPATTDHMPQVIVAQDGTPFKTETAAKSHMTKNRLNIDEYIIIEDAGGGYIITKV